MPVTWDATAELRLLICCLDPSTKPNWEKVAAGMGSGYTSEACRQRFGKIKKAATENSPEVTDAASSSPVKRSRGKKDTEGGTPSKKNKKKANIDSPVQNGHVKEEKVKDEAEEKPVKTEADTTA